MRNPESQMRSTNLCRKDATPPSSISGNPSLANCLLISREWAGESDSCILDSSFFPTLNHPGPSHQLCYKQFQTVLYRLRSLCGRSRHESHKRPSPPDSNLWAHCVQASRLLPVATHELLLSAHGGHFCHMQASRVQHMPTTWLIWTFPDNRSLS